MLIQKWIVKLVMFVRDKVNRLIAKGYSHIQISKMLGISRATVVRYSKRRGTLIRSAIRSNSKNVLSARLLGDDTTKAISEWRRYCVQSGELPILNLQGVYFSYKKKIVNEIMNETPIEFRKNIVVFNEPFAESGRIIEDDLHR